MKVILNCGYRRMRGHLTARGLLVQWNRLKDSMKRVCPEGILMRALQLTAVHRRFYHVRAPLSLWHIDGNHELIRLVCHLNNNSKQMTFLAKAPQPMWVKVRSHTTLINPGTFSLYFTVSGKLPLWWFITWNIPCLKIHHCILHAKETSDENVTFKLQVGLCYPWGHWWILKAYHVYKM